MVVAVPFIFAGLGHAPFDDPGEGMHAEIARELSRSGDALRLTLNGVPYVDKPPLLYVLLAGAFAVGGPSELSARMVPAMGAVIAVGATAWLGARLLGGAAGLVAGGALLTSVGFFAYARYVRPETLFVAALAGGFALTLIGVREGRRALIVGGLAAFGLAGLAKDPAGAFAPLAAVGLALALCRRARPLGRWLPWPGGVALVGLAVGWWVIAEMRTPGTLWYTVIDNHILNVAGRRHFPDEDVPLGAGAFVLVAMLGAAPWALAAGAALVDLVRRRAWRDPAELPWTALGIWTVGVLGATLLSHIRLPHYGLPVYPALALLAARAWQSGDTRRLLALHAALFALAAAALLVAWRSDGAGFLTDVLAVTDVATRKSAETAHAAPLPPWEAMRPLLGTSAAVLGAGALVLGLALAVPRLAAWGAPAAGAGVALIMLAVLPAVAAALATVTSHRAVRAMAIEVGRRAAAGDIVAHEGPIENSGALEWYSGRRPVIVGGERSVIAFGATLSSAPPVFWSDTEFREAWRTAPRVWLLTTRTPAHSVLGGLPGARLVSASGGRRLYVNR